MEIKCKIDIDDVIHAIQCDPRLHKWLDEDTGFELIQAVWSVFDSEFESRIQEMISGDK